MGENYGEGRGPWRAEYLIPPIAAATAAVVASFPIDSVLFVVEVVVASVLVQWAWPWGAALTLFLAAGISGYTISLSNLTTRPEQVAVLVLLPLAVSRRNKGQWESSDTLLVGFIAVTFLSSAVSSPVRAVSIKHAAGQSLAVISFWLARRLAVDNGRILGSFLGVGVAGAIFGILCYGSHYLLGTEIGIMYYPETAVRGELASVQGSHVEANIFGSYVACFSAIFFSMYMKSHKPRYLLACIICSVALALSLARAAWLGLAVAVVFVLASEFSGQIKKHLTMRSLVLSLAALSVGLGLWYSAGSLRERAQSVSLDRILDDPTLLYRVYDATEALGEVYTTPLFGLGTDSFELTRAVESAPEMKGAWIGNLSVRVLHDTGIVGVSLLLGFFYVVMRKAWRSRDPAARALLAGSIVLTIAFQFSDGTVLAYPWVLFGLMAAATGFRVHSSETSGGITNSHQ